MRLGPLLPQAKDVLNEVTPAPQVNHNMKLLTRRRRQLVDERILIINRMHTNLHAIAPGLLEITGSVDNLWFLHLLTARDSFEQILHMRRSSIMKIKGVGHKYAELICNWKRTAKFFSDILLVGNMVIEDAKRILDLSEQVKRIELKLKDLIPQSRLALTIESIVGFGLVCSSELAGEIGTMKRFSSSISIGQVYRHGTLG